MKKLNLLMCATLMANFLFSQTVSTFENLTLAPDTFWNGSDLSGGFSSGNAYFTNDYDTSFQSWSGFVYTDKKDSTTAGYGNQYSAITASGYGGSANYAIADEYGNAKIRLMGNAAGKPVNGFYVTNTTYAYLSMKNGDQFAKQFGGPTGNDPDWFRLRVLGWKNGVLKQQNVDFFLADFRFTDSTQDYIVRNWTWVDLQPLGDVDSILFNLSSSDTSFGFMNTPAYFAIDNFTTSDVANAAPVANDDNITITYLQDTLINVLANDFDTTALPLIVQLIGSPLIPGATDTVINNQILYTPAVGIVAIDTLVYQVCDADNLCDTAQVIINLTGIDGIDEIISGLKFSVYPNPFSEQLSVYSPQFTVEQPTTVSVYDETGKEIFSERITSGNRQLTTDNWAKGIYFVKLSSSSETSIKKIVKQ